MIQLAFDGDRRHVSRGLQDAHEKYRNAGDFTVLENWRCLFFRIRSAVRKLKGATRQWPDGQTCGEIQHLFASKEASSGQGEFMIIDGRRKQREHGVKTHRTWHNTPPVTRYVSYRNDMKGQIRKRADCVKIELELRIRHIFC